MRKHRRPSPWPWSLPVSSYGRHKDPTVTSEHGGDRHHHVKEAESKPQTGRREQTEDDNQNKEPNQEQG